MTDILLNTDDGDIVIANNDLSIGISDQQQQERLLLTEKGNVKQYPDAGVGSIVYLESEDDGGVLREINLQFSADGMKVKSVSRDENKKILINAAYQ